MNPASCLHCLISTEGGLQGRLNTTPLYSQLKECEILLLKRLQPSGHESWVLSVAMNPQGTGFVSGGSDAKVKLWDIGSRSCMQTAVEHTDQVGAAGSLSGSHVPVTVVKSLSQRQVQECCLRSLSIMLLS